MCVFSIARTYQSMLPPFVSLDKQFSCCSHQHYNSVLCCRVRFLIIHLSMLESVCINTIAKALKALSKLGMLTLLFHKTRLQAWEFLFHTQFPYLTFTASSRKGRINFLNDPKGAVAVALRAPAFLLYFTPFSSVKRSLNQG